MTVVEAIGKELIKENGRVVGVRYHKKNDDIMQVSSSKLTKNMTGRQVGEEPPNIRTNQLLGILVLKLDC